jgi:hypothetical protein
MKPKICSVYVFVLAAAALIGLIWRALNAGTVPTYGDTTEYLRAAQSLQIDQYRTIL